ncbi:hypothetical protein M434DRAFT_32649 [Hypoxylon sp. CO27-5]|nr:hypothetical protein M434DRAFT_32649 [Hypoxylon sp. CO27-5]
MCVLLGILVITAVSTVLADFTIYIGKTNDITDIGVVFSSTEIQIHKHYNLSCSDVGHVVPISVSSENDASKGHWACDGCGVQAAKNWPIKRLEMYNGKNAVGRSTYHPIPLFNRATGAVTLYKTENSNYDMRDINNSYLGTCNRPLYPQEMDCRQLISATFLTHVFTCTSDLTPNKGLWKPD